MCVSNEFFFLLCLPCRTAAEAMVMNPPEPTKEKEKQGFFRAIKKKKKKTQIVRTWQQTHWFRRFIFLFPPGNQWRITSSLVTTFGAGLHHCDTVASIVTFGWSVSGDSRFKPGSFQSFSLLQVAVFNCQWQIVRRCEWSRWCLSLVEFQSILSTKSKISNKGWWVM